MPGDKTDLLNNLNVYIRNSVRISYRIHPKFFGRACISLNLCFFWFWVKSIVNFAQNWLSSIFPNLKYSNAKFNRKKNTQVHNYFTFFFLRKTNQEPCQSIFNLYFYKTYKRHNLLSEIEQVSLDLRFFDLFCLKISVIW